MELYREFSRVHSDYIIIFFLIAKFFARLPFWALIPAEQLQSLEGLLMPISVPLLFVPLPNTHSAS